MRFSVRPATSGDGGGAAFRHALALDPDGAFVAESGGEIVGRTAGSVRDDTLRIVTLEVKRPGNGAGGALLGAVCIAFSGIFYRWAEVTPSTGTVFRALFGLPLLGLVAWLEHRRYGGLPARTVRLALFAEMVAADVRAVAIPVSRLDS